MTVDKQFFPIATCDHVSHLAYAEWYCVFEKLLLATAVAAVILLTWQIKVQGSNYGKYKGFKMGIYWTCISSAAYVFIHFGILSRYLQGELHFIVEIYRFTIMLMLVYYFISRASKLFPNYR